MTTWLINKRGPHDWRPCRRPGDEIHCKRHPAAMRAMNTIIRMNNYPPLAA
jgi:hypothetical protein